MNSEPIVSIDWLQFFCDFSDFVPALPYVYEVLDVHARVWSECGVLSVCGRPLAHISRAPYSSVICPTSGVLKIDNAVLYMANAVDVIENLLATNHIRILSLTRIDICGDFTRICNQQPGEVIRAILSGKWLRVGQSRFYGRGEDLWKLRGIRQVSAHCWCAENSFEFLGSANTAERFTYLRYGSRSSEVCVYLYNKSLELRQVKDKPYIRRLWDEETRDVWRLEFSLKGKHVCHIEREMRRGLPTKWQGYFCPLVRSVVYSALCQKYFDIRENTKQVRKDREKRVTLFQSLPSVKWQREPSRATPSNRADKIFLRKLAEVHKEIYDKSAGSSVCKAFELGREYAKLKDLAKWCEEHDVDLTLRRQAEVMQDFAEFSFE